MAGRFNRHTPREKGVAVCGGAIGEPQWWWKELVEQQWGVAECRVGVAVVCAGCALPERVGAVGNGREVGSGGSVVVMCGGDGDGRSHVSFVSFVFLCVSFVFPFVFLLLFGVSVVDVQWCSHDGQWKKENDLH